ncbi:GTPase Era [Patescibacteria group bacterium]|nr:GTPase Era [Patescibacteria group bacterium]
MVAADSYKVGKVAIVGRPNVGKSTLLNALLQHKVAIVSPKPQTTRSQIEAYFEDKRGQIFFLDTPGFYSAPSGTAQYNALIADAIRQADIIVYVVDHTRDWGQEEERMWNQVQASEKPAVLVINKIDVAQPSFLDSYKALLSKHVQAVVEVSASRERHLKPLMEHIFALLPSGVRDTTVDYFPTPLLSQSSKEYLAEIIREKVYRLTGQEVPYQTAVRVTSVEENEEKNILRVVGEILVSKDRYKGMLIGKKGQKIGEIRKAVRKELELATNKEVHINLRVVTRWQ